MNVKKIRKKFRLTQAEVALALKIPVTTYASYEQGTNPPIAILKKLAKLFNCTVDELLGIQTEQQQLTRVQQEVLAIIKDLDARTIEKIKAYILGISDKPLEIERWS